MKKVIKYEIVDHGIDHAQYFQFCGTTFTEYDDAFTGAGSNYAEALEDAIEQAICSEPGYDFSTEAKAEIQQSIDDSPDTDLVVEEVQRQGGNAEEECELYYYVSIRVKGEQV